MSLNNQNQEIIIPFIEGDGIGPDIFKATKRVVDSAFKSAYGGGSNIVWKEIYAGIKAKDKYDEFLPQSTIDIIKKYKYALKGPLRTPIAKGFRSINVLIRQTLDLYACVRPIKYFPNLVSPVSKPHNIDVVIFRENTEDVYSGVEFEANSEESKDLLEYLKTKGLDKKIKFNKNVAFGIKNISLEGSQRLIRSAINYAIEHKKPCVTLVHKGNIMKFTEGSFKLNGYQLVQDEFDGEFDESLGCYKIKTSYGFLLVNDRIADAFFQDILINPMYYSVVATMNLNGDYISDAIAAQVGGIGISPGANINYQNNIAVFEATHGTADIHADQDTANPSSLILSAYMLLKHLKKDKAAEILIESFKLAILSGNLTEDLIISMDYNKKYIKCSEFADIIIKFINNKEN